MTNALILLTTDLATQSKVAGNLAANGLPCQVAMSVARLQELLDHAPQSIVAIDLATAGRNAASLIVELKQRNPAPTAVLAFGPHVHEAALAAAQAAGADGVYARGQFLMQAGDIARQWSVE
jgi:DNA-binding NarL/FixJ family response regulator